MNARNPHIPEPRSASPVVIQIFEVMRDRDANLDDIANAAGVGVTALRYWAYGCSSPSAINFEAVAQVLGYRLVLERMDEAEADTLDSLADQDSV